MSNFFIEKASSPERPVSLVESVTYDPSSATSSRRIKIGRLRETRDIPAKNRLAQRKTRTVVKRKLRGVVLQFEGERARVVFVHEGHQYQYNLPSDRLIRSHISVENQPFEMIELETVENGIPSFTVRFEPMAPAGSAKVHALPLSDELQQMRQRVLHNRASQRPNAEA